MLLAHAGTPVAQLGTGPTQQFGRRRKSAHPPGRERAKIRAILAQPDAELLKLFVAAPFHPDHVVGATVADLCAGRAGIETVLHVCGHCVIVMMHKAPLG
jgi:hypothetical protein